MRPFSAVIRIRSVPEANVVAEVISDAEGRFRIALPPGRYVVEPQQGDPLPIASPQEVTVPATTWVHIRVDYDSGIR